MTSRNTASFAFAAVALAALAAAAPSAAGQDHAAGAAGASSGPAGEAVDAAVLYHDYCSVCHGDRGDGESRARGSMVPPPRDFTSEAARALTRESMIAVVSKGKAGTAMAPWETQLGANEIAAVVDYIRDRFIAPPDSDTSAEGARIYARTCSVCHGDSGGGAVWASANLNPQPRDFTASAAAELSRERMIHAVTYGRPDTAMPGFGTQLDSRQVELVVDFVRQAFMRTAGVAAASGSSLAALAQGAGVDAAGAGHGHAPAGHAPELPGDAHAAAGHGHGSPGDAHAAAGHGHGSPGDAHAAAGQGHGSPGDAHAAAGHGHGSPGDAHAAAGQGHGSPGDAHAAAGQGHGSPGDAHAAAGQGHGSPGDAHAAAGQGHAVAGGAAHDHDAHLGVAGAQSEPFASGLVGSVGRGEALYRANCVPCHGEQGNGRGPRAYFILPKPRNFTHPASRSSFNRPHLFQSIARGKVGSEMAAWDTVLDAQAIADIAEYVFQRFILGKAAAAAGGAPGDLVSTR